MNRMSDAPACRRCGTCCRKGGPALHREDAALFEKGVLDWSAVVTLRRGELARDPMAAPQERSGTDVRPLAEEILKLKGKGQGWTCVFFLEQGNGCAIYADRPLECRLLNCRDTGALEAVYATDRLVRSDLVKPGSGLAALIADHEERCSCARFDALVQDLEMGGPKGQTAHAELLDMLAYDQALRHSLSQRAADQGEDLDPVLGFLFGAPLAAQLARFGLALVPGLDGPILRLRPSRRAALRSMSGRPGLTKEDPCI